MQIYLNLGHVPSYLADNMLQTSAFCRHHIQCRTLVSRTRIAVSATEHLSLLHRESGTVCRLSWRNQAYHMNSSGIHLNTFSFGYEAAVQCYLC